MQRRHSALVILVILGATWVLWTSPGQGHAEAIDLTRQVKAQLTAVQAEIATFRREVQKGVLLTENDPVIEKLAKMPKTTEMKAQLTAVQAGIATFRREVRKGVLLKENDPVIEKLAEMQKTTEMQAQLTAVQAEIGALRKAITGQHLKEVMPLAEHQVQNTAEHQVQNTDSTANPAEQASTAFKVGASQNSPRTEIQSRFEEVYEQNLWGDSESRSGPGSTLEAASGDIKFIQEMVRTLYPDQREIHIADIPCGDMAWMPTLVSSLEQNDNFNYTVHYHGYDVVPQIVAANKKRFAGQTQYTFSQLDGTYSPPAKADVLISRDVLNHLPVEDDLQLLRNFVESGTATLLLSNNRGEALANGPQQLFYTKGHASRLLDLEVPPFSFPEARHTNGHLSYWTTKQAHMALLAVKWPGFKHQRNGAMKMDLVANTEVSGEWTPPPGYHPGPYVHSTQYDYRPDKYTPGEDGTFAQNYQDVWFEALAHHNKWLDKPGFYLDLGAFQPWQCSNTALLDLRYKWTGVCVEPRHEISFANRNCVVVNRPMSGPKSDQIAWMGGNDDGSQIFGIDHTGSHKGYEMRTINGPDLIKCVDTNRRGTKEMNCEGVTGHITVPNFIHLVNMDTEGTEHKLLRSWPWDEIKVAVFIIENEGNTAAHEEVRQIMLQHGYHKTQTEQPGVDEYYVLSEYWHPSLETKEWRNHPEGSFGC